MQRRSIKVEYSREAHQAIITRLGGDLRCERDIVLCSCT